MHSRPEAFDKREEKRTTKKKGQMYQRIPDRGIFTELLMRTGMCPPDPLHVQQSCRLQTETDYAARGHFLFYLIFFLSRIASAEKTAISWLTCASVFSEHVGVCLEMHSLSRKHG